MKFIISVREFGIAASHHKSIYPESGIHFQRSTGITIRLAPFYWSMFRPCIDLHEGKVKQIVGGTLGAPGNLRTNFVAAQPAAWFAELYKRDGLNGRPRHYAGAGK